MTDISNLKNLKLLWWLRSIAILGQAGAIFWVSQVMHMPLPTLPLWSIVTLLFIVNVWTWFRLKKGVAISEKEFFGQLLIDMTALFGLLYLSGGAMNPFTSLFILQVVIAAITLPACYTWIAAGLTVGFYTILMVWYMPFPSLSHHHGGEFFNLHVQGMWVSFLLLAMIVAWFVVRMNVTIRRQHALLAEAEKMATVGTLAANAAHELGTPLATLMVLAEEYALDAPAPERQRKAHMFSEQLARCKQILSSITAAGGVVRAEGGKPVQLDWFLRDVITRWQSQHAEVKLHVDMQNTIHAPRIVVENGLEQALTNLLQNAAEASPNYVSIETRWTPHTLTILVTDQGKGIEPALHSALGQVGTSTKQGGLGLGLFLVKSVIARLEGQFSLQNSSTGGAIARIELPLRKITV